MIRRLTIVSILIAACLAQTSAPPILPAISAYYRLPTAPTGGPYPYQWVILDPPLSLYVDPSGSPHLGVTPTPGPPGIQGPTGPTGAGVPGPQGPPGTVTPAPGMALISSTPGNQTILMDTSFFAYRGVAPTVPGNCAGGTGIWATDGANFYICVADPVTAGNVIWARAPLVTTW